MHIALGNCKNFRKIREKTSRENLYVYGIMTATVYSMSGKQACMRTSTWNMASNSFYTVHYSGPEEAL